ncbi:MAG: hypothetical protein ACI4PH_04535 [Faecousia sp.]
MITYLLEELDYSNVEIPRSSVEQKRLLRSLMNIRPPAPIDNRFLSVQNAYLRVETAKKGITDLADLTPVEDGIYL